MSDNKTKRGFALLSKEKVVELASRGGNRGFALMDKEKLKGIASQGGKAVHSAGKAHLFSVEEARAAGQKGGRTISQNRAHMRQIGRKGGVVSGMIRRGTKEIEEGIEAGFDRIAELQAELDVVGK
jgi:uncharacterized protein